jgi:hypothetical protein
MSSRLSIEEATYSIFKLQASGLFCVFLQFCVLIFHPRSHSHYLKLRLRGMFP